MKTETMEEVGQRHLKKLTDERAVELNQQLLHALKRLDLIACESDICALPEKFLPKRFVVKNLVWPSVNGHKVDELRTGVLQNLATLRSLKLRRCSGLIEMADLSMVKNLERTSFRLCLANMRCLDIIGCSYLIEMPDLSRAKNLEWISLRFCENLVDIYSSIQHLKKLRHLDLYGCKNLKNCPRIIDWDDGPIYVITKQYDAVLGRRQSRARAIDEADGKLKRNRKEGIIQPMEIPTDDGFTAKHGNATLRYRKARAKASAKNTLTRNRKPRWDNGVFGSNTGHKWQNGREKLDTIAQENSSLLEEPEIYGGDQEEEFLMDISEAEMPLQDGVESSSTSGIADWTLLIANLLLECISVVFDQLGYALLAMVMAFIALVLSIVDIIHIARKERITCDGRSLLPYFRRQSAPAIPAGNPFGTVVEYFGLAGAVWQCLHSTMQYAYARQNKDNPIKICLLPVVFVVCVIIAKLTSQKPV